jgi:hypothetical protein
MEVKKVGLFTNFYLAALENLATVLHLLDGLMKLNFNPREKCGLTFSKRSQVQHFVGHGKSVQGQSNVHQMSLNRCLKTGSVAKRLMGWSKSARNPQLIVR